MEHVAYYRVSTHNQSRSGLGIEAQKSMVRSFISTNDTILKEFIEVESGKNNNRPKLQEAIAYCKSNQAILLIAKLDRLSRNAAFIFQLRDSEVEFRAVDMPDANALTVGIMAVLAQHERELISERTRRALQIKKQRGDKMGTPENLTKAAIYKGMEVRKRNALNNQANVQAMEMIYAYRQNDMTFQEISDKLNLIGMKTRFGKKYIASTVRRLYKVKLKTLNESV
ncbi:recombinase family protein [Reichenbachiella carrageenanivorans]|uniref:Recombinase family protein n=2 Tax=Reichenbachiella carrageenanivorans TaxID=2979869 RepID=A0ABY6D8D1_9BACT|nr:recombinase family protein [Reichenbachiella carrageenanivorans]UXX81343.1 recombinase family protein [Reichenbachiella carrageenanivorans]